MFGSLGYWHLIEGAPRGSIEQRASALLALCRAGDVKKLSPGNPGAAKDIARAMALELAVAATFLEKGIPAAVVELVLETLPKWAFAVIDPSAVYSGKNAGPGAPDSLERMQLKALCCDLDCAHAMKTGPSESRRARLRMKLSRLFTLPKFRHLSAAWSDTPNVKRSVMRWRADYDRALKNGRSHFTGWALNSRIECSDIGPAQRVCVLA